MERESLPEHIRSELQNGIVRVAAESYEVETSDEGVVVKGLALPYEKGSRNGFVYIKESVESAAQTMQRRPFLFNHDEEAPIGHVKDFMAGSDGVEYVTDLNPNAVNLKTGVKFAESFERGDISNVSIKCAYDPEKSYLDEDTNLFHAWVTEFWELSAVTIPGFADTTAAVIESYKAGQPAGGTVMTEKDAAAEAAKDKQEGTAASEADDEMDAMQKLTAVLNDIQAKMQDIEARIAALEEPDEASDSEDDEEPEPEEADAEEPADADDMEDDEEEESATSDEGEEDEENIEEKVNENRKVPHPQEAAEAAGATITKDDLKEAFISL